MDFIEVTHEDAPVFIENIICETDSKLIVKSEDKFYSDAVSYWKDIPATVDGMLGGFGHISEIDIQGSRQLLKHVFQSKQPPGKAHALDCGAGIGRVTKHLLLNFFDKVDLVEQNPEFLENAKKYLGPKLLEKVGNFYPVGLQSFEGEDNKYDVIWSQWVLGHLTDSHLVQFLKKSQKALKENGVIIIKDNIASGDVEIDKQDSSITRTYGHYLEIFEKAGLKVYKKLNQKNFPRALYTVYMFVLKPVKNESEQ